MEHQEITQKELISKYMNHVLNKEKTPKSVYKFCKKAGITEDGFYKHFSSMESIAPEIFTMFFKEASTLLAQSEEYPTFDARGKLLSFYFTFFELLTANRSYVSFALKQHKNELKNLKILTGLRKEFKKFIDDLGIEKIDFKHEKLEKIQEKTMGEAAWVQLLFTLKFWLEDRSISFEKTDILIEKSVNASFDLINTKPVKSMMDLGKFLFKEHINCRWKPLTKSPPPK